MIVLISRRNCTLDTITDRWIKIRLVWFSFSCCYGNINREENYHVLAQAKSKYLWCYIFLSFSAHLDYSANKFKQSNLQQKNNVMMSLARQSMNTSHTQLPVWCFLDTVALPGNLGLHGMTKCDTVRWSAKKMKTRCAMFDTNFDDKSQNNRFLSH